MLTSKPVLILGSAPAVIAARDVPKSAFSAIVVINNAWRVRDDWDYHVAPDDFPKDRMPESLLDGQQFIGSDAFVPANNAYGGIIYAGATMAFTAGYWVLSALHPSKMVFCGCDMVYPAHGRGHFYGKGSADPLRDDITLRNLEAKSARLMIYAARQGCVCLRAPAPESRLVFPQADPLGADQTSKALTLPDMPTVLKAEQAEADLGYIVESGRYWEENRIYSTEALDAIDELWLSAFWTKDKASTSSSVA